MAEHYNYDDLQHHYNPNEEKKRENKAIMELESKLGYMVGQSGKTLAELRAEEAEREKSWKHNKTAWQQRLDEIEQHSEARKEFNSFVRWFVEERTKRWILIPSDIDIDDWAEIILAHAKKVFNEENNNPK